MQPGVLYPARLLLLAFDVPNAMRVSALAHVLLIVVATYGLLRALGSSRTSAAAGTVVASVLVGAANVGWTSYLEPAAWFPVAAFAMVRLALGDSVAWALVLGAAAGLPVLAGGYQVTVYIAYALAALAIGLLADRSRRRVSAVRFAVLVAVAAALAAATAAPQITATLAWTTETVRGTRALTADQIDPVPGWIAPLGLLRQLVTPAGSPSWLYFSWPVLVLGAVGTCSSGPLGAVLGGTALAAMLLAPGRAVPWFSVYERLPGIAMLRLPVRLTILAAFLVAPLVGLGLDALRRHAGRGSVVVGLCGLAAVAAALVFPIQSPGMLPWTVDAAALAESPAWLTAIVATAHDGRAWWLEPPVDAAVMARQAQLVGRVRVVHDYEPLSSRRLASYLAAVAGTQAAEDYAQPEGVYQFAGQLPPGSAVARPALLAPLAVRALVLPAHTAPPVGSATTLRVTTPAFAVWALPNGMPRAWVVYAARPVDGPAAARSTLVDPGFDPRREVILEGDTTVPGLQSDMLPFEPARIAVDKPEYVQVDALLAQPGVLVLADAIAPGWEASVDGHAASILPANLLLRGIVLGAGRHDVIFTYHAPGLRAGVLVFAVGWASALLATIVPSRRRFRADGR
jgi:hypothetical protein